jgi:hypothetical protein
VNYQSTVSTQSSQGIPSLPDLTHPDELINFGTQIFDRFLTITLILVAFGLVISFLIASLRRSPIDRTKFLTEWLDRYSALLRGWQHIILIIVITTSGFFLCATLANRYHHWEQQKIIDIVTTVSGERMEQNAPIVKYKVEEKYSYLTQVDGKVIKVEDTREIFKQLAVDSSEIDVQIAKIVNPQDNSNHYKINFAAIYKITNTLPERQQLYFELAPLYNYSIFQNLKVERNKQFLKESSPNSYTFILPLAAGESTSLKVTYLAEGAPRWVYNAGGQLISNFRMTATAYFSDADFASGITPTETKRQDGKTIFTWLFQENVSVKNPFGIFTAVAKITSTGVLPRLLLLAPAIFLWWLLLLYLSLPMDVKKVAIVAGLFFACLLTLTYGSRLADAKIIWLFISILLIVLTAGLGRTKRESLGAIICSISGAIVPVYGFLIPYTGISLSLAGLLSTIWLVVNNKQLLNNDS